MRHLGKLFAVAILGGACRGRALEREPAPESAQVEVADGQGREGPSPKAPAREADAMLDTGIVLRDLKDGRRWGVHLMLPAQFNFTDLDLDQAFSLEQVASISLVPTAEFIVPLDERWTLLPFIGLGAAWQTGARDLIGGNHWLGLATGGLRSTRWQRFARRNWFGFTGVLRYDAALGAPDGLLGDWGNVSAAFELRRDFGAPDDGTVFQGGLYVQGTWFWDPVELDVAGLAPEVVVNNGELGISLGSSAPYKVLGITMPRLFIGAFTGDGISGLRVRFGRL